MLSAVMDIFVVDSDPDLRIFIEAVITADQAGHAVKTFDSGSSALAELTKAAPDVLLTDLSLCGASGEELARTAALLPRAPRVVLMSADHRRLQASASLAQASLRKPFAIRDLALALGLAYSAPPRSGF
jgi:CheY-like chemotaxis protein